MAMVLDQVVPFGRSFDEYCQMFALSETDLSSRILSVADGPASFNAEGTQRGYAITSLDPVYAFSGAEIRSRFEAVVDNIIAQVEATPQDWVWTYHASPAALKASRIATLETFLQDYEAGQHQGRYILGELPQLPFPPDRFDLILCSHFLFLYSQQVSQQLHQDAILAMLTVAPEVRIFPLLTLGLERSPHLEPILALLTERGHRTHIQPVPYQFQRGGNEILVIWR